MKHLNYYERTHKLYARTVRVWNKENKETLLKICAEANVMCRIITHTKSMIAYSLVSKSSTAVKDCIHKYTIAIHKISN